jgi:hypothetical protein
LSLGLPQFFVRAVVKSGNFVELARICFKKLACAIFVSELGFRVLPVLC